MSRKLVMIVVAICGVFAAGFGIPFNAVGQGFGGGQQQVVGAVTTGGAISSEELSQLDASSAIDRRLSLLTRTLPKRISLNLREVSRRDALRHLATVGEFHLEFDRRAIEDENLTADLDEEDVTIENPDISLLAALNLLLRGRELDWIVRDESLTITTRSAADEQLETAFYDVSNLVTAGYDLDPTIEAITSTVAPENWDLSGGSGSIRVLGRLLVIRQSQRVHDEVALFLGKLGRLAAADAHHHGGPAGVGEPLTTKVYSVNARDAGELAEVITEFLKPESWHVNGSGAKGFVRSVKGALIVYQTPDVHTQIRRMLQELPTPPAP